MISKLRSCSKTEIPDALMFDHEMLREKLIRAAAEPGRIGEAAERVAQLCLLHFASEEENVFRAIDLLNGLAPELARSNMAAALPIIARISAQHLTMRGDDHPVNAAIEELLREANNEENEEIRELVSDLRDHEEIEDQVMYPTLLFADAYLRDSLRNRI
jgi:hemerythrin superfamily protein